MGQVRVSTRPSFRQGKKGVIVRHSEYMADVTTINGLLTENYPLAPGNPLTFPWLADIAGGFQRASVINLSFEYRTELNTSVSGVVMLSYILDVSEPSKGNKYQILQIDGTMSGPLWQGFVAPVKPDPREILIYYGTGYLPNTDPYKYAFGQLQVSTEATGTNTAGEVWVNYEIELFNPSLETIPCLMWGVHGSSASEPNLFGANMLLPYSTGASAGYSGNILALPSNVGSGGVAGQVSCQLPVGGFFVLCQFNVDSAESFSLSINTPTGVNVAPNQGAYGGACATDSSCVVWSVFQINEASTYTISVNYGSLAQLASGTNCFFFIMPYDGNTYPV